MPARWPEVEKAQALRQEHGLGDAYVDVFDVLRRMDIEVTAGLSRTALWKARSSSVTDWPSSRVP